MTPAPLRPVPLKIAAALAVLLFGVYGVLLIEVGPSAGAIFWGVVLALGIVLAWFADQLGRRAAQVAAGIFAVLGVQSPPILAAAFGVLVILCFTGFLRFGRGGTDPS